MLSKTPLGQGAIRVDSARPLQQAVESPDLSLNGETELLLEELELLLSRKEEEDMVEQVRRLTRRK